MVGTGPAGLAAALALADLGLRVAAVGPLPRTRDTRTAALFAGSVTLLENLGVGDVCRTAGEPIHGIRIIDDMGGLLRAPEVTFTAAEARARALRLQCAQRRPYRCPARPRRRPADADPDRRQRRPGDDARGRVDVLLDDGRTLTAPLVVGADGRQSMCRQAAGIAVRSWTYEQSALVCTFSHQRPHGGISTEFHRPAGPLTVVPSPGRSSSLVWVERPAEVARLASLDSESLRAALDERLQGLLGGIGDIGPRASFPLSGMSAEAAGRSRVALVGEAVHVIPPIGAQGLNLGLRDAACIADCVADALAVGEDIGGPAVLEAYGRMRRTDVASRIWGIDLLNRTLLSQAPPVQALRGLGLHILKNVGPVRRLAIREGLAPSFIAPRLMQARPGSAGLDEARPPGQDRLALK